MSVIIANTNTPADGFYNAAKTNKQLIADCYASGGSPVVNLGGQFISCDAKFRAKDRQTSSMNAEGFYNAAGYKPGDRVGNDCLCYGNIWSPNCCPKHRKAGNSNVHSYSAEGFYNASGTDAAQKNIADATANLNVAKNNLADALAKVARTEGEIAEAKQRVADCEAARAGAKGGNAKDRACGDLQSRFDHWGRLSARLQKEKGNVEGARLAVTEAESALRVAKEAAEAAKNADPTYAIQQQQLVAQQNKDQAQLNANIAADLRKSNIIKFSVIGGLVLGAAALGLYFMSKKRKGAASAAPAVAA